MGSISSIMAVHALSVCALCVPVAQAASDHDWATHLQADARAFHAALAENHPGPVDDDNPGFSARLDAGLAQALSRARQTRSYGGYWWALREFQATFDDGHVQLVSTAQAPALAMRWPGFLTGEVAGQQVVTVRDDAPGLPPMGAVLTACDGIRADDLTRARVGRFWGNWSLTAQRQRHAGRLLLDADNPWAPPPLVCRFVHEGVSQDYPLHWQALAPDAVPALLARTRAGHRPDAGVQMRGEQLWISLPGFTGNSDDPMFAALGAVVTALDDPARVADAPQVVLDVRGNGGGSSHWSIEVATRLWGDAAIKALPLGATRVDWRVSAGNLEAMRATRAMLQSQDAPNAQMLHWADVVVDGMAQAQAGGVPLWRQPAEDTAAALDAWLPPRARALAPQARVFVLADAACASACLDALDLWLPLGAVLVGGETSADTVYMDTRDAALPSGLSTAWVPMKVYRGRSRGHNVPYVPAHAWQGEFSDDAALAAWIDTL